MNDAELIRERAGVVRCPLSDRSPIHKWARRHVVLPESYATPGPFNAALSPWLIPIFDALQDPFIRLVHFRKAVQTGGTLIADVWVPWIICNDPGPISWTMPTDDVMERHCKSRLNPLLERCKPVAEMLPRPGPHRTTTEIYFGGFFLTCNAANMSAQQSQSIRYKINDEVWMPKWQDIYGQAIARVTKYEEVGRSKILNISQAPVMDELTGNVEDLSFRSGQMAEWSATCPACKRVHPLQFSQALADSPKDEHGKATKRAGVVWDAEAKRDDETWDVQRASASARFRCPHCAHESPDADQTREAWRRSGHYVATRTDNAPENVSFHIESLPTRPMRMLVQEFCEAENHAVRQGENTARIDFRTKREAKPWIVEKRVINLFTKPAGYKLADYAKGEKMPDEAARFMLVDRQQDHWWCIVVGWTITDGPRGRLLFFGRIETRDMLRATQHRFGVADACVAQDRGFKPSEVDRDCAEFGWRGMRGHGLKTWTMRDNDSGLMVNYPFSEPCGSDFQGVGVYFYNWSGDHFKDLIATSLEGKGNIRFDLPDDCPQTFLEHLKGESKVEIRPGVWSWKEVKSNAPNHGLDCLAQAFCVATIAGLIKFMPTPNQNDRTSGNTNT